MGCIDIVGFCCAIFRTRGLTLVVVGNLVFVGNLVVVGNLIFVVISDTLNAFFLVGNDFF